MNAFIGLLGQIWWQILIGIAIWFGIILYFRSKPKEVIRKLEKNAIRVDTEPPVYLKKSSWTKEWRLVYPIIKLETIPMKDGEFDYDADWSKVKYDKLRFFFGSKAIALRTLLVVALIFLTIFGVYNIIASYHQLISNPLIKSCLAQAGISL